MKKPPREVVIFAVGTAFIAAIWFLVRYRYLNLNSFAPASIRDYIQSYGDLAVIAYITAYVLNTISVIPPIAPLSLAAGLAFGAVKGAIYLMIGAMIGTSITFGLSRFFARGLAEKMIKGKFKSFDDKLRRNGFTTILFFRIIPLVPYEILNYASGLSNIRFRDYFLASFLGFIPGVVIAALFGGSLGEVGSVKDLLSLRFLTAAVLIIIIFMLPVLFKRARKGERGGRSR